MSEPLRLRFYYLSMRVIAWLAFRVFGLRRRIIRGNLARSFPDWPIGRIRQVEREHARRQGELAAELLYAGHMPAEELRERVRIVDPALLESSATSRPQILVGAHHGNFEWMLQRLSLDLGGRFAALYKPMRSPRAERWFRRLRTRYGARLVPAKSILRELAGMRDVTAIGLIADQVPRTSPEKHWTHFLGQDTAFYMGPELLGRALKSRVCIVIMHRLERGRYELRLEALNVPGEKLPAGELTDRYARALEAWIREDPAGWWWAHDRWKLRRDAPAA
jgi:KDO2-lipid IV(A) lauroyltransferase